MIDRRQFSLGAAFVALASCVRAPLDFASTSVSAGYGALERDPAGLLDLPRGFTYRVISQFGERMSDGLTVPDRADGMGCTRLDARRVALVRNHELSIKGIKEGPFAGGDGTAVRSYDRTAGGTALPGGTTTIVYDTQTGQVEAQHLSLVGTIRNCAGGTTPWGSWLSCEEDVTRAGTSVGKDHGWIFEVPAALRGIADPVPLTAMGRFNHEAAAVDPTTGIVYLTEDRDDGLFYRFLPNARGRLSSGGRLQALAIDGLPDTRNRNAPMLAVQRPVRVRWIDLDGVDSTNDDLRKRGAAQGAALFARGEGVEFGDGALYFACTSGGAAKLGQVFRFRPGTDRLDLFVESTDPATLNYGDNLTVAPNGHLIVCEDQYTDIVDNHLRGVTREGRVYTLARLTMQTELAGACFSPDGRTLFVNAYSPTKTLAIAGPWDRFRSS